MNAPHEEHHLTPDAIQTGWEAIRSDLFRGVKRSDVPLLLLIGGQPGAGKSTARARVGFEHRERDFIIIDFDAFRKYHPRFQEVVSTDPLRMPEVTHEAAKTWTQMAMDHARANRYDVINENVLQTPSEADETTAAFKKSGYIIHAVAVAVTAADSRLGMLERYLANRDNYLRQVAKGDQHAEPPRWTDLKPHDDGYIGLAQSLDALENSGAVDRLSIMDRAAASLYDTARPMNNHPTAAAALEARRSRPMPESEVTAWHQTYKKLIKEASESGILAELRAHDELITRLGRDHQEITAVSRSPQKPDRNPPRSEPEQDVEDLGKPSRNLRPGNNSTEAGAVDVRPENSHQPSDPPVSDELIAKPDQVAAGLGAPESAYTPEALSPQVEEQLDLEEPDLDGPEP